MVRIFHRNVSRLRIILFCFESLLIFGILNLVNTARFLYRGGVFSLWVLDAREFLLKALTILVVCQACMYFNELYDHRILRRRREMTIRLLQSFGIACILLSLIFFLFEPVRIGQITFSLSLPAIILCVFVWRELYSRVVQSERFGARISEKVLVLGSSNTAKKIIQETIEMKDSGFDIAGVFVESGFGEMSEQEILPIRNVFPLEDFPDKVGSLEVDRIVVAMGDRRGRFPYETLLDCRFQGIQVEEGTTFYEALKGKILLEGLRPSWFIFSEGFRQNKFTLNVKRASDLALAALLLTLLSPVLLIVAMLIKLDSRGPAIYKQDRVGQAWKEYTLYKFRSMVESAEANGAQYAVQGDPRITRIGRLIRRYRIDELPQLFNVLMGHMSFVGPRPERRFFVKDLAKEIPYYSQRLFVKPGITGWAQIKYHYGASRDETIEKLQYDLYYIKHMSFFFDLTIILDTVRVVVTGKGAR